MCGCCQLYEWRMNELTIKTTAIWICIIVWFLYVRGPGSFCFVFKKTSVMYFSLSFWFFFFSGLVWIVHVHYKSQSVSWRVIIMFSLHIMCPCAQTQWRVHNSKLLWCDHCKHVDHWLAGVQACPCPLHWLAITRHPHYAFLICHSALVSFHPSVI